MNHASCAREHWTQITTRDETEGRHLSTHLDVRVSSVTQKIRQNRLRIVTSPRRTLLAVQAIGDPAFNSGGAARTRLDDAMLRMRLLPLHPRVCPLLTLAVLPARNAYSSVSFPMLAGSKPTLVLLWPLSRQGSRLAPARAVRLAEDTALSAASVLAASFIAALPFPTASFVAMLSRCYPPTSFIVCEQMKG